MMSSDKLDQVAGGIFLLILGVLFFLPASGLVEWGSVGFLFAFVPVFWILVHAWRSYEANGRRLNGRVISQLLWSLFPFAFIGLWYAGLNVGRLWPLVLIFIGATMLLNQAIFSPKQEN